MNNKIIYNTVKNFLESNKRIVGAIVIAGGAVISLPAATLAVCGAAIIMSEDLESE